MNNQDYLTLSLGDCLNIVNNLGIKNIVLESSHGGFPLVIEYGRLISNRPMSINLNYDIEYSLVEKSKVKLDDKVSLLKQELGHEIKQLKLNNSENADFRTKLLNDVIKKLDSLDK